MRNRVRVTALIAAFLLIASVAVVHATITDDIDPQGASVFVTLSNPGPFNARGAVSVTAWVGGTKVTESTPFDLSSGTTVTVEVGFLATVDSVHSVSLF